MLEVVLVISSSEGELEVSLKEGHLFVGLNNDEAVIISEHNLPEAYAEIHRESERLFIQPGDHSAHPVLVNGEPVPRAGTALRDEDQIRIGGDSTITVRVKTPEAESPAEPVPARVAVAKQPASLLARALLLILPLIIGVTLIGIYFSKRKKASSDPTTVFPNIFSAPAVDPYRAAIEQVQQDRGEMVGRQAKIDVPSELKLYSDRKRFLAIQVAEWRKQGYRIPRDFTELALMEQEGEFVRVPQVGPGYVLYGVGVKANDELTHYDQASGKSVPIFSSDEELKNEQTDLAASLKQFDDKVSDLRKELQKVNRRDRGAIKGLQVQIADTQKAAEPVKERKQLLDSFYQSADHRKLMVSEYETLANLARDFGGKSYDLNDANSRKDFKIALLSCLRPAALARLQEIGQRYQQKFDCPLPITSMVRTKEYQRYLNEAGNPNATRIDVPPHTTGLAFDVYTHYMSAAEQQFLMDEIAQLKREGKVEALRENRDHIHVFIFPDGVPPSESLIKRSLSDAAPQD